MNPRHDWSMAGIDVIVPPGFDINDGVCVVCGGQLDTGWECNDCGADHMKAALARAADHILKEG